MDNSSKNIRNTEKLASELAKKLKPQDILCLYGDLGSGKTTFTRFLVKELGFNARVQSPTFVVHRIYEKDINQNDKISKVNHLDLYRLKSIEEVEDLGIQEIINESNSITIIEWPQLIEQKLPKEAIKIYFEYKNEDERNIDVQNID